MPARVVVVLLFSVFFAACNDGNAEEPLGTLEVVAERTANTCGTQSQAYPARFEFSVRLLRRGQFLRWQAVGAAETTGTLDPRTGAFRLSLEQRIMVAPPDRRRDFPGCSVQRSDVIEGTLTLTERGSSDGGSDASEAGSADASVATTDGGATPRADAGIVATGFQGIETIQLGEVPGGDCRELIGVAAGQVTSLPCVVNYTLRARVPMPDAGAR